MGSREWGRGGVGEDEGEGGDKAEIPPCPVPVADSGGDLTRLLLKSGNHARQSLMGETPKTLTGSAVPHRDGDRQDGGCLTALPHHATGFATRWLPLSPRSLQGVPLSPILNLPLRPKLLLLTNRQLGLA
ncbi:hypothetical protein NIES4075_20660 [Tolypothrix sp. NIES-4075]|nr:hypothetical protein NIES4075_20660 [Tolypothrix sp. NIES-4075]